MSPDEFGLELPDLDVAYLEAFQAAQGMWSELLTERSDPLLRSFEIADASGRVLLTLPFREVLDRARKPVAPLPNEVKSAQALMHRTGTLIASLREEIGAAQEIIAATQRSMQQTQSVVNAVYGVSNERK